jgi:hypothetical protein
MGLKEKNLFWENLKKKFAERIDHNIDPSKLWKRLRFALHPGILAAAYPGTKFHTHRRRVTYRFPFLILVAYILSQGLIPRSPHLVHHQ